MKGLSCHCALSTDDLTIFRKKMNAGLWVERFVRQVGSELQTSHLTALRKSSWKILRPDQKLLTQH